MIDINKEGAAAAAASSIPLTELAWAAGFFDGEGYTGVVANRSRSVTYWVVRTAISQVDRRNLERFQTATGAGIIRGPYRRNGPNAQPIFRLDVTDSQEIAQLFATLAPFLGPAKHQQFADALALYETRRIMSDDKKLALETRQRMAESAKARWADPENRARYRLARQRVAADPEFRRRMSVSLKNSLARRRASQQEVI